jgi:L-asparaginase II
MPAARRVASRAVEPLPTVRVVRSGLVESVHVFDVAVVDERGRLVGSAGDPNRVLFARSSMKPLQAAVSLSFAPFSFTDGEVALMCASHNAEPVHIATVRSLLARAAVEESRLQTPSVRPWDDDTLASDPERRPINSDCSGKHAGMLAACFAQGWSLDTYRDPGHPLQAAVRAAVVRASRWEQLHLGVDGCGVPVHGMPLRAMAAIYARLARPDGLESLGVFAGRAVGAMRAEPYLVAGRNRVDTAVMQQCGSVVAKGGAEGLMCGAVLDRGLGVAVKVRDGGAARAAGPAFIQALRAASVLDDDDVEALAAFASPAVVGGERPVGRLAVDLAELLPA